MSIEYTRQLAIIILSGLLVPIISLAQEAGEQTDSSTLISEVERAAAVATEACVAEIEEFCSDVTPGGSRILACLQAYRDRVGEECDRSLLQWHVPDVTADFQTTQIYPTLEHRELGEQNVDENGERVIWPYRLPFLAQQVVDLGFELPNPYGVAIIPARIRQDLILENFLIGVNGPPDRELDFIDFGTPSVENNALQLKLDAWVLPFLNVFATVGVFDGDANIPLKFEGTDLQCSCESGIRGHQYRSRDDPGDGLGQIFRCYPDYPRLDRCRYHQRDRYRTQYHATHRHDGRHGRAWHRGSFHGCDVPACRSGYRR